MVECAYCLVEESIFISGTYIPVSFFCRLIGQRWKNIDPDRLAKYAEMAAEDTERYKTEMQTYNGRQEAKMRSEALKPPAAFQGHGGPGGPGAERFGAGPGVPPGMEAAGRGGPGGYSQEQMAQMSAFGNPGAAAAMGAYGGGNPYGGMEGFGGYGAAMGMGAYGMGAYGGYGAMGGQEAMGMGGGMGADASAYGRGVGGGYGAAAMGMMGGGFQGAGMMGYG